MAALGEATTPEQLKAVITHLEGRLAQFEPETEAYNSVSIALMTRRIRLEKMIPNHSDNHPTKR